MQTCMTMLERMTFIICIGHIHVMHICTWCLFFLPSSMPLRIWLSSSSVYSQWCSFQLSPVSLRKITSSLSFPLRAAKWGISTITGLTSSRKLKNVIHKNMCKCVCSCFEFYIYVQSLYTYQIIYSYANKFNSEITVTNDLERLAILL